ncbi:MAG TPA: flagellar biosynthesis anti-sigma factor FlgM [Terracidiphilus sp.]|nr:flagellar biosynthesis anti-sigma factor FlgM [Terracidiphilus sp.]
MDVRNNLDGLKSLLGVQSPPTAPASTRSGAQAGASEFTGDRATLSSAGSEASLVSAGDDIRMEKVAAVQAALAAGSYSVPATAVATKIVDAMLAGGN